MRTQIRVSAAEVELDVPLARVLPQGSPFLWCHEGEGIAAWGEAVRIEVGTGPERFERARSALADAFDRIEHVDDLEGDGRGPVAFGSFTFDEDEPGSVLVIPERLVISRGGRTTVVALDGPASLPELPARDVDHDFKIRYAGSTVPELGWLDAVDGAIDRIGPEGLQKVVLARDVLVWSKQPFDIPLLIERLALRFPQCYTFSCGGLVGATPELLIERRGGRIRSLVLAGSAPLGVDAADALIHSEKDLEEHRLSVESVAASLARVGADVAVGDPYLLQLPNIQHIATDVAGAPPDDGDVLSLVAALHPTAAVCGTPTQQALDLIREVEGMGREGYAGPVGWIDRRGDGEWGIALRCAQLGSTRGRLFAGAGIVGGSEPEAELEETRVKLRAMMSVLEAGSS